MVSSLDWKKTNASALILEKGFFCSVRVFYFFFRPKDRQLQFWAYCFSYELFFGIIFIRSYNRWYEWQIGQNVVPFRWFIGDFSDISGLGVGGEQSETLIRQPIPDPYKFIFDWLGDLIAFDGVGGHFRPDSFQLLVDPQNSPLVGASHPWNRLANFKAIAIVGRKPAGQYFTDFVDEEDGGDHYAWELFWVFDLNAGQIYWGWFV